MMRLWECRKKNWSWTFYHNIFQRLILWCFLGIFSQSSIISCPLFLFSIISSLPNQKDHSSVINSSSFSLFADDESIALNSNSLFIHSSPAIRPKVASFIRTHKLIFLLDFRWSFSTVCCGTVAMNLPWLTSRTQVISHSFAMIFVPNEAPLELSSIVIPGQKKCARSATRRVHENCEVKRRSGEEV